MGLIIPVPRSFVKVKGALCRCAWPSAGAEFVSILLPAGEAWVPRCLMGGSDGAHAGERHRLRHLAQEEGILEEVV